MRSLFIPSPLAALTLAFIAVTFTVPAPAQQLPISGPWLKDRLPPGVIAYQRIPHPLGLMAMPKGNMLDAALASEANIGNLVRIRQGLEDNLDGEAPLVADPAVRALIAHLRSPVEIAVLSVPAPSGLIGMTLDIDSNAALEDMLAGLAQYPPFPSLAGPLDDQGFGELVGLPLAVLLNFDAATGRLALFAGPGATRAGFAALLAPGPDSGASPMSALETQIDTSGQGFFGWIDTRQALQLGGAMIPPETNRLLQLTGASEMRSLAYGAGVADGRGRLELIADVGMNTANRLLPVVDNQIDARSVGAPYRLFVISIPGPGEFARLESLVFTNFAPDAADSWAEVKAAVGETLGVSIEQLLTAIGPELIAISDEAGDYAALKVRDRAVFDDVLARLASRAGIAIEDHDYQGRSIHEVRLPRIIGTPAGRAAGGLAAGGPAAGGDAPPLPRLIGRMDKHLYWIDEGDFVYVAGVPQLLMDRFRQGADTRLANWLAETQHVDLSASLLGGTASIAHLPRRIYASYLTMMQAVADILDVDYDPWSMPTAGQLDLPDRGVLGFSLNLGQPYVSFELSYESHPAEWLFGGGGTAAVAMAGVAAAIAIPAYQDYTIRAEVAEGLTLAAEAKAAVGETYQRTGEAPADRSAAGMTPDAGGAPGSYVASIDVADGVVVIRFGNQANPRIADRTLALTPYRSPDGSVVWGCGFAAPADLDALGEVTGQTTIERKYLPSGCR